MTSRPGSRSSGRPKAAITAGGCYSLSGSHATVSGREPAAQAAGFGEIAPGRRAGNDRPAPAPQPQGNGAPLPHVGQPIGDMIEPAAGFATRAKALGCGIDLEDWTASAGSASYRAGADPGRNGAPPGRWHRRISRHNGRTTGRGDRLACPRQNPSRGRHIGHANSGPDCHRIRRERRRRSSFCRSDDHRAGARTRDRRRHWPAGHGVRRRRSGARRGRGAHWTFLSAALQHGQIAAASRRVRRSSDNIISEVSGGRRSSARPSSFCRGSSKSST